MQNRSNLKASTSKRSNLPIANSEQEITTIRLNKFIAERTGLSRREVDERIAAGRVKIDGHPAALGARLELPNNPHHKSSIKSPAVTLDGKSISSSNDYVYLLFNKPVGYVCSKKRQGSSPTIYELLPKKYRALKTVGRLDRDSSGLILFTNDGDFAYRMTHPRFKKVKIYEVELDHSLKKNDEQKIISGVKLTDGLSRLGLAEIKKARDAKNRQAEKNDQLAMSASVNHASQNDRTHFRVTMTEGRNRQIRRTFAALGYEVIALHRIAFGPYSLDDLMPGHFALCQKKPL